ncbi:hypothetical protein BC829DRAFT_380651 [Chytridium lagenaria]|nr:hypothetical protein BC829DRAFT_380651 [Chytridium lagenaria]
MNTSLSLYSTLYGGTPSVTSPSPPPFPVSDDHRQNPHHLPRIDPERKRATVVTGQMKGDEEKVFTVGVWQDLIKRLSRTSSHTGTGRTTPNHPPETTPALSPPSARTAKLLSRSPQKGLEEASKKRAKMLQYASTIKKPVLKLPPLDPYPPPPTARHEKYSRTINELEALQEEHARNLKVVEGISGTNHNEMV